LRFFLLFPAGKNEHDLHGECGVSDEKIPLFSIIVYTEEKRRFVLRVFMTERVRILCAF
jgi:hypothetical protein